MIACPATAITPPGSLDAMDRRLLIVDRVRDAAGIRGDAVLVGDGRIIAVGRAGALALDGTAMDESTLLARLAERRAADSGLRVRLNADGAAEVRHILPLAARLSELGYADVVLVVTPGLP